MYFSSKYQQNWLSPAGCKYSEYSLQAVELVQNTRETRKEIIPKKWLQRRKKMKQPKRIISKTDKRRHHILTALEILRYMEEALNDEEVEMKRNKTKDWEVL